MGNFWCTAHCVGGSNCKTISLQSVPSRQEGDDIGQSQEEKTGSGLNDTRDYKNPCGKCSSCPITLSDSVMVCVCDGVCVCICVRMI